MNEIPVVSQDERYAENEARIIASQRKVYEAQYPPPEKPVFTSSVKQLLIGFGIMLVAAMIVSGSHTIPQFQRSVSDYSILGIVSLKKIVGVSAFTMIEVGMVMLAYSRIKHYTSTQKETWEHNMKLVPRLILGAMVLVLAVALMGNVYSTLTYGHETESQPVVTQPATTLASMRVSTEPAAMSSYKLPIVGVSPETLLFVLLGVSAPALTLLSGEVIGYVGTTEHAKQESKLKKWREDLAAYNEAFLEWRTKQRRGVWRNEADMPPQQQYQTAERVEKAVKELQPIYIDKDRRKCPACEKTMHRASWTRHPCRFEEKK